MLTSTPRTSAATQGAESNYKNPRVEPPDHGIGRSRGGLTSKIHHLVDGAGRPLVVLVSVGQAHDAPMFEHLLAHLKVGARARTRPTRVRGDKAYSNRMIRAQLRRRRIGAVIPEPADQLAHRKRRGSHGGRPPTFDAEDYKGRNVIERSFNVVKQWRGLATRYDKLAIDAVDAYAAQAEGRQLVDNHPAVVERPELRYIRRIRLGQRRRPGSALCVAVDIKVTGLTSHLIAPGARNEKGG